MSDRFLPDKDTIDGMTEHLLYNAVPSLIAKVSDHLDNGVYSVFDIRAEIIHIEHDLERLREMREAADA